MAWLANEAQDWPRNPEQVTQRRGMVGMVGEGLQYHVWSTGTSTGNISSIAIVMDVDRPGEPFVNEWMSG